MKHILKCTSCGKYTMKKECACGGTAGTVRPPKYSPDDKYAKYRRQVKKKELEEADLL